MSALPKPTAELATHCWPVNRAALHAVLPSNEALPRKLPHTLCPVSVAEIRRRHKSNLRDLAGMRSGSVVIVGLISYRENGKSRWSARCDCGCYEERQHANFWRAYRMGIPDACRECMTDELRQQRQLAFAVAKGLVLPEVPR